jgi:hypothetical protein
VTVRRVALIVAGGIMLAGDAGCGGTVATSPAPTVERAMAAPCHVEDAGTLHWRVECPGRPGLERHANAVRRARRLG